MKISLEWLREFVDTGSVKPAKLGELITLHTAEVEEMIDIEDAYENMVVGKVLTLSKHPNADKLYLAQTEIGEQTPVQIVCGGENLKEGMLVTVAVPGAWVKWHGEGEPVQLSKAKIRDEKSWGMICAGEEIGLESDNPEGQREVRICDLSHLKAKPGTPLAKALGKTGASLDIDNKSLTHRPDLWGHYGMAREVAAILKKPLKSLDSYLKYDKGSPKGKFKISIKNNEGCPRFSGCIVTGVCVTESPQWMKSRLEAAGVRPINNIVDITNYVMLELGEPMHAYDRKDVGSDELIVRNAKKGETLETIDHKERKLTEEDLLICNAKGTPLGLAGVMGGANSEISDSTTEIILEAANFNPVVVRKMSTRHGLRSDASQRFEKGLDPTLTERAISRALVLLKETCPDAKLVTPLTTEGKWKAPKISLTVDPDVVNSKIGTQIPTTEMTRILKALDFGVTKSGKKLKIDVPTHRATGDVSIEDDIVEEVGRLHSYDSIEPILPKLPIHLPIENEERFHKHATRNILANNLGFTEVMNYSFYSEELFHKCGLQDLRHIKVKNYLSSEQTHMRISLIPGMLQSLEQNSHEYDDMKLFEIGRTYREIGEYMPLEEKWMVGAIARRKKYEVFYEIKGALEAFLREFRPANVKLEKCTTPPTYAHPKKCREIRQRGDTIGYVFELHPGIAKGFNLEHNVGFFELNFTHLTSLGRQLTRFEAPPKYPGMAFDVSFLIDRKKEAADIERAIRKADPQNVIRSVRLFDMYHGAGIPEDQKSLAFNIELRHDERTLTDDEFQKTQKAVFKTVEKLGGKVRT